MRGLAAWHCPTDTDGWKWTLYWTGPAKGCLVVFDLLLWTNKTMLESKFGVKFKVIQDNASSWIQVQEKENWGGRVNSRVTCLMSLPFSSLIFAVNNNGANVKYMFLALLWKKLLLWVPGTPWICRHKHDLVRELWIFLVRSSCIVQLCTVITSSHGMKSEWWRSQSGRPWVNLVKKSPH